MPIDVHPFRGLRPKRELAEKIAAPPYDVLSSDEARAMAAGNELSFLHVGKPEIDLDPAIDLYDDRVYQKGKQNYDALIQKAYARDPAPRYYIYQQRMGDHVQAGIVAGASVDDYQAERIKKHELTRIDKEIDRTRHIEVMRAHTGPVFLTYRAEREIDAIVDRVRGGQPEYDFVAPDQIGHTLWVIDGDRDLARLHELFAALPCLYVADGHHRSASGARVRDAYRQAHPDLKPDHEVNYFLAVIFPHDQMQILPYNRVVKDLHGLDVEGFKKKAADKFELKPVAEKQPDRSRCFGMFLGDQWYRLTARPGSFDERDPVKSLDVSILQANLLDPILGIQDPRTDKRIDFVGGIRGVGELERRCRKDCQVAFSMFPTTIDQLMAIADAGQIMPPKSTWFEPKLRDGMVVHDY
ncbi:MAG: DUF1015 domain-containing protein [Deltaproteobacteria bacterium]|nr:DUF1015 domain-containing protein [Deltaproteobacteria bacterium]